MVDIPSALGARHSERVELTVRALSYCPAAAPLLDRFVAAMKEAVRRYPGEPHERPPVLQGSALKEALNLDDAEYRTLSTLLFSESWFFGNGSGNADGDWTRAIRAEILVLKDVTNIEGYLDAVARYRFGPRQITVTEPEATGATEPNPTPEAVVAAAGEPRSQPAGTVPASTPDPRAVAVAHGRDEQARQAMFDFLRALGLLPLEWGELVARAGSGSPYTGEVVRTAFRDAKAVVVLFTPDEEARLHPELWGEHEPNDERSYTPRPRANVILEAGMGLMSHAERTIIVEVGRTRLISNLAGMNVIRISGEDTARRLNDLKSRLEAADCPVNATSGDWLNVERFDNLTALRRRVRPPAADTEASRTSSQSVDPTEHASVETILRELGAHVEVATTDLLPRGQDLTTAELQPWAGTTGVTIRNRCGRSLEGRFLAEGQGRGLTPLDELNTKLHFIQDDLSLKARGGHFATGPWD